MNFCSKEAVLNKNIVDGTILFVGASFARICRRGSADVLLRQVIPQILVHVRSVLSSNADVVVTEAFETKAGLWFWFKFMEAIKDPCAVETLSEMLLHQLATEHVTDLEAYWVLWILFHSIYECQTPFSCCGETIDWEFGLATSEKGMLTTSECSDKDINKVKTSTTSLPEKEFNNMADNGVGNNDKTRKKSLSEFKLVDPSEIIDPATLNNELVSGEEEDDDASENSETSSDSSLQPYDLSDDDTDLKIKFSQLVDVVGALRKSDDADGKIFILLSTEPCVLMSSREICHHVEAFVRKSVLFAASCILVALHPSYMASSLIEDSPEISKGLEWVRTWALHVAELDTDRECYTVRNILFS
ncbi:embryo defective 2423 [Actinidia rufa]|uniref:Embryo defective 2423 n=1 Tax=Actinidia rufa TaxID=165716 RepID=A0A7J0FYQ6_9ERIC|nr:embryo defective 2423 [Actinidia rufa]